MNASRDRILSRIGQSLENRRDPNGVDETVKARIEERAPQTIPDRAVKLGSDRPALVDLFISEAERVDATTDRLSSLLDVPKAISEYLGRHNLPSRLRIAPHPDLQGIPWSDQPLLEASEGIARDQDSVGVSVAYAGVAETGTLLLRSGPDSPTTLNFLPDTHIVVLKTSVLTTTYEAAWDALRKDFGPGGLPRTVNWTSGPSRSADIEQTLMLGAHGPRQLHILIVDDKKER